MKLKRRPVNPSQFVTGSLKAFSFCMVLSQTHKWFGHWNWDHILIGTDLKPSLETPRESCLYTNLTLPAQKQSFATSLQWLYIWITGWERGNLFKISICTERFWIKPHLTGNLENHDRPGEMMCLRKDVFRTYTIPWVFMLLLYVHWRSHS